MQLGVHTTQNCAAAVDSCQRRRTALERRAPGRGVNVPLRRGISPPLPSSRTIRPSPSGTLPHAAPQNPSGQCCFGARDKRLWRWIVKFPDTPGAQPAAGASTATDSIATAGDRRGSPCLRRFDLCCRLLDRQRHRVPQCRGRAPGRDQPDRSQQPDHQLAAGPLVCWRRQRRRGRDDHRRRRHLEPRRATGIALRRWQCIQRWRLRARDRSVGDFLAERRRLPDGARVQWRFTVAGLVQRDAGGALHGRWAQLGSDHVADRQRQQFLQRQEQHHRRSHGCALRLCGVGPPRAGGRRSDDAGAHHRRGSHVGSRDGDLRPGRALADDRQPGCRAAERHAGQCVHADRYRRQQREQSRRSA